MVRQYLILSWHLVEKFPSMEKCVCFQDDGESDGFSGGIYAPAPQMLDDWYVNLSSLGNLCICLPNRTV